MQDGHLRQFSNIGEGAESDPARRGTRLETVGLALADGLAEVAIANEDDDSIGLAMRVSAQGSYRFLMDAQASFRRLIREDASGSTILHEDQVAYRPGRFERITMETRGEAITVWINGAHWVTVQDPGGPSAGEVALLTAWSDSARFDALRIAPAGLQRPTLGTWRTPTGFGIRGAAPERSGQDYRLALSGAATPGVPLASLGLNDPRTLPLRWDDLFILSLDPSFAPFLPSFAGTIGTDGSFTAGIVLPPLPPALSGQTLALGGWTQVPGQGLTGAAPLPTVLFTLP